LTGLTENVASTLAGDVYSRGGSASGTYAYDKNGNMINDSRRALDFGYNVLNLLREVKTTGGELKAKYDYLADGTRSRVRDNGDVNGFDYLGSLTYRKSGAGLHLESANFGDGVIRPGDSNSGQHEVNYFLTDHLGSVRVIVDGTGKVLERNDYYPFGARHARSDYPQLAVNRYKYNGKEEQVTGDLGYLDYGARMYDSGLGRWFGVDPFQESFISLSPYNYCSGNPMVFIDPNGAFMTHYVDKNYNVLLQTDDGSDDVVVVPDGYIGDFKKFASFYSDPELAPVYDSKGWNSYWKNKFGLASRQLSELELAVRDLYSDKDGKNKAIAYFLSHQGSDLLAAAWSETSYHLRNVESWVDGLLMAFGVGRVSVTSKVARKSLIMTKVPVGRSENIMSSVARNSPVMINGVKFTGHALDQMQARGILSPTAVLDVVKNPARVFSGNQPGTMVFIRDNLKIVTNKAGDIVTVIWQ